ncbi:MAG: hypothetical protein AAGD86_03465, partial [Pseudomonadota bacterium]
MTVLLLQLAALLIGAAGAGALVGWQLERHRGNAQLAELEARAGRATQELGTRADAALAELETTRERLGSVEADHKQASRRLRNLTGALSDSESTIAGLEADIEALQEQVGATPASADDGATDALAAQLAEAGERADSLSASLRERDSALEAMKTVVDARDATITKLQQRLASGGADTEVEALRAELKRTRRTAANHAAEAETAHARRQSGEAAAAQQIARLRADLDRLRPRSAAVEADLA